MVLSIVLGLIFGSALTIFALENTSIISVNFLSWQLTEPVAFMVAASAGLAAILGLIAPLPTLLRYEKQIKELRGQVKQAQDELAKYSIVIPIAPPAGFGAPASPSDLPVFTEREMVAARR